MKITTNHQELLEFLKISMIFGKAKWISGKLLQYYSFCSCSSSQLQRLITNPIEVSKHLNSCFKLGRIEDAKKVFDETPLKTIVHWSIMIYGYGTNGFHLEAIETFSKMRVSGTAPNSYTIVGLLVSSVSSKNLGLGRSAHGLIVKLGFEKDLIVGTAVLNMYAKCRNIEDSYKFFEGMDDPGLVSCSAIVSGFISNELFAEAISLFNRFRGSGLVPNSVSLLSVIQGGIALESCSFCESTHGLVVKTGQCSVLSVINAILDMYSNLGDLEAATKIFKHMKSRDIISWSTMMGLYVRLEYASDALALFVRMRNIGISLDTVVLVNLIMASALLGDLRRGRSIHAQAVLGGFSSNLPVSNSIIAMYSKCGEFDCSRIEFNRIKQKSLVSWTAMISGCVQNGRPREALELLVRMRGEQGYDLDPIILNSLFTACGELAGLDQCQQLHAYTHKAGFQRYRSVQNTLVSVYSKCGVAELAHRVFKEMNRRDIVSWNAIISGFGINGCGQSAVTLFKQMRNDGEDPDTVTYLSVLTACSHSGLVDDGLMIFNQMVEENKIKPNREHCGCIIDMLARAGRLSDASRFMNTLSENVDPYIWRALLGGCRIHSDVELAELAAKRLFLLKPQESGDVVLLSNVYTSAGRFKDAEVLRSNMKMTGLMKDPGISLLDRVKQDLD